jgi:SAM-dependent methyltransferase
MPRSPAEVLYPEVRVGGFTRVDGGIEFFQRVNALITAGSVVADIGAGRGSYLEDSVAYRRELRHLQGRAKRVIGLDVDPVVLENPAVDEAHVIVDGHLPLAEASVDLVVSAFTFEHVTNPATFAAEITRVLRPGGWVCALTPNRRGYIGVGARLVPNKWHVRALRRLQPAKPPEDTFDVAYMLNTRADLKKWFTTDSYDHYVYTMNNEPAYFGSSMVAWRAMRLVFSLTPERFGATYFIFLQKRAVH